MGSPSLVPVLSTILMRYLDSFEISFLSFLCILASSLWGVRGTNKTDMTSSGITFVFTFTSSCGLDWEWGWFSFTFTSCVILLFLFFQNPFWFLSFFLVTIGSLYHISFTPNFFLSLSLLASSSVRNILWPFTLEASFLFL